MKYYLLLLVLAMHMNGGFAQDSLSAIKHEITFRISVRDFDGNTSKGYLRKISDSVLYLSATPVSFNPGGPDPSLLKPFHYKDIITTGVQRGNSVGHILIGTAIGAAIGALAGIAIGNIDTSSFELFDPAEKTAITVRGLAIGSAVGALVGALTIKKTFIIHGRKAKFSKLQDYMIQKAYN